MIAHDIFHSCGNSRIAQAALRQMDRAFVARVERAARSEGLSTGEFVAENVKRYRMIGSRAALQKAIAGSDQPVLKGLRHILRNALNPSALGAHSLR